MISGIFTSLAFVLFLGVGGWAYSRHNRMRFDEAARLPFCDEDSAPCAAAAAAANPAGPATANNAPCCCKEPKS